MWPIENKVPLSTSGLLDIIKMARSWKKRAPDKPETKPTIVMSQQVLFLYSFISKLISLNFNERMKIKLKQKEINQTNKITIRVLLEH